MGEILAKGFRMLDGRKFSIRHARVADSNELLLFTEEIIWQSPHLLFEPAEYQSSLAQQQQQILHMLEHANKLSLVAVYEDEIIGMLQFSAANRKKLAHSGTFGMSVSRTFRGQGVGKALLSSLLLWGRNHPLIERIELEVMAENVSALHLYKSAGFETEGIKRQAVKNSMGVYDDLILMCYWLDQNKL